MQKKISHTINELKGLKDNDKVVVGGLITSLKYQVSKRKLERYAILRLEDFTDSIEVMVFPNYLKDYESELAEESVLMMSGRIRIDIRETQDQDGETVETRQAKLILESAKMIKTPADKFEVPAEKAKKNNHGAAPSYSDNLDMYAESEAPDGQPSTAELRIHPPDDLPRFAKRLKEILSSNPGKTQINLTFIVGSTELSVDLGDSSRCDLDAVERILGSEIDGAKWSYK